MLRTAALLALVPLGLIAQSFSGRWEGTVETPGGPAKIYLSMHQEAMDLAGSVTYAGTVLPIESASVNADEATIATRQESFHFRIDGAGLKGEVRFRDRQAAVRLSPLPPDATVVVLSVEAANIRVLHSMGPNADQKAIAFVRSLKLRPMIRDDRPRSANVPRSK
ncbi:MAG TPA: hypothetical protein VKU19_10025 [Bryobacteraceae bacterium]|nr:hypothetical protein [Bryobacteraceae bacterium]